ncbi:unnamed protein product [Gordionus sp. m RMFG-2023]
MVCLRYLATGCRYPTLAYSFKMGISTIQKIVRTTCKVSLPLNKKPIIIGYHVHGYKAPKIRLSINNRVGNKFPKQKLSKTAITISSQKSMDEQKEAIEKVKALVVESQKANANEMSNIKIQLANATEQITRLLNVMEIYRDTKTPTIAGVA